VQIQIPLIISIRIRHNLKHLNLPFLSGLVFCNRAAGTCKMNVRIILAVYNNLPLDQPEVQFGKFYRCNVLFPVSCRKNISLIINFPCIIRIIRIPGAIHICQPLFKFTILILVNINFTLILCGWHIRHLKTKIKF